MGLKIIVTRSGRQKNKKKKTHVVAWGDLFSEMVSDDRESLVGG